MFKPFGERERNREQKSIKLWNRDFDIVEIGLDEKQVSDFVEELIARSNNTDGPNVDAVKSLMERAIADAEDIINNVKAGAQDEADRIINEAKRRASEIKGDEELSVEKEAEEIISLLDNNTEPSITEVKQRIHRFLLKIKSEVETEVRNEYQETRSILSHSQLETSDDAEKEIDIPDSSFGSEIISTEKNANDGLELDDKQKAESQ